MLEKILISMEEYQIRFAKSPSHIYLDPEVLDEVCNSHSFVEMIFGMKIVPCSEMPEGKRFFVTA